MARNPTTAFTVPMSHNSAQRDAESISRRPAKHSLKMFDYRGNPNIAYLTSLAENDFHSAFGNLLSHRDSKRDTDQIRVLELHPGPLVPVIQNYIESGSLKALGNVLGSSLHRLIFHVHRRDDHIKRSNRFRQPEPVLVIALFDRRSQDALDADPVASHDRR